MSTYTKNRRTFFFNKACAFKIDFGAFAGKTIDEIAKTDRGLLYLDNLNGKMRNPYSPLARALNDYLTDEAIASDLEALIEENSERFERR